MTMKNCYEELLQRKEGVSNIIELLINIKKKINL